MLEWNNTELDFDDMPDSVTVALVGTARVRPGKVLAMLSLKFKRNSETVSIELNSKERKIWPEHETFNIDEYAIAAMFNGWIEKFNKNTKTFKSAVLKAASKADPGVSTWLLSLL